MLLVCLHDTMGIGALGVRFDPSVLHRIPFQGRGVCSILQRLVDKLNNYA